MPLRSNVLLRVDVLSRLGTEVPLDQIGSCKPDMSPLFAAYVILGLILLIGIVTKNGIMLVDFALKAERER